MNAPTAAVLVSVLAVALAAVGGGDAQHAGEPEWGVAPNPAPYHLVGGAWQIPGPFAWVPEYAFAQTPDVTPPTFVSSELNLYTGVLSITFSETIDVTPDTHVVPTKMHIRESGTYTGGVTLDAGELDTVADGNVISFTLTASHLTTVTGLTAPELTIEPGAVRDTAGNLIIGTFDVSTASFVDAFSIKSQEIFPTGVAFSSNGTKMFVVGSGGKDVNEYTLSTQFDVSTASFVDAFSVVSQETVPQGVAFSSNGTKMFVVGIVGGGVNEYTLSTPFDVSTASFVDAFSVASQDTTPTGVAFSSNGTKMFVAGRFGNDVNEYTLSTPFSVSTASFVDAFSIKSQETSPYDVAFSSDGAKMFVVGIDGQDVNEYTLSTQFDVSTASFVDAFSVASQETSPSGVAFSSDGAKMFVVGSGGKDVNEYTLSSVYPITVIDPFVTTWRTSADNQDLTIPVHSGSAYNYTVIWDDGSNSTHAGNAAHTYDAAGDHKVQIYGTFPGIHLNNHADAPNLVSIDQWGSNPWASMESAFAGAEGMTYVATDVPDLSGVADMSAMFASAASFNGDLSNWNVSSVTNMNSMFYNADAFNQDLNSWDVSSVTTMFNMFRGADAFNGDLSSWNVSSVTTMSNMFRGAVDFNGDISSWNVSSVTDMSNMFHDATDFNGDISGWDVSKVRSMTRMFNSADAFNQDLDIWNTSHVTDMSGMFTSADAFNGNISSWDVSSVTNMGQMFNGASSFDQNLGEWYVVPADTAYDATTNTLNVTTISAQNSALDGHTPAYDIGTGGNSTLFNMTDSTLMFKATPSAGGYAVNVTAPGGNFGTNNHRILEVTVTGSANSPLTVMAGSDLTVAEGGTLALSGSATDTNGDDITSYRWSAMPAGITFADASSASTTFTAPAVTADTTFTLTLTANDGTGHGTDTINVIVKETSGAFITTWRTATAGESITIPVGGATGTYDVIWGDGIASTGVMGNQTHPYAVPGNHTVAISGSFERIYLRDDTANASKLMSIDQWGDIGWVSMESAFYGATNVVYAATDSPDLSGVTNMFEMFSNAVAFNGNISNWNVSSVTIMSHMFAKTDFNWPLNSWDVSSVTHMRSMFFDAIYFNQDLHNWNVSKVTNMARMFSDADSFNQDISGWNVSKVTNMRSMFDGAALFQQDLGEWYVVPADTAYDATTNTLNVTTISAQNPILDGHTPAYDIGTGGNFTLFNMTGSTLMFKNTPSAGGYAVNVTAPGGNFGTNNHRILEVTVTGSANSPPTVMAGSDLTVAEGGTLALSGSADDTDGDDITSYRWTATPAGIAFANASSASTTFTAP